jgi:threonine dehydrogenase-like Zn-dependent dehydrogenase
MEAVWLQDRTLAVRNNVKVPEPPPGEALIRLRLAGICGTDLELVRGYYPYRGVLGHEFVGEVITSPDRPELEGNRVVGAINAVCHQCVPCLSGRSNHCLDRTVLGIAGRDGAFADYLTLPVENLSPVPDQVLDEAAVFVEPLASALQIQEQVHIRPSDRVLMIGAGRLGQLIGQTLSLTGAEVNIVARYEKQRELMAPYNVAFLEEAQVQRRYFDFVVEVTGSSSGFALAKNSVKAGGTIVLKSTYKGNLEINISEIVVDEITLVGSRCGDFQPAINLLAKGMVDPTPLIENRYPLKDALAAFAEAGNSGVMKILLEPGG